MKRESLATNYIFFRFPTHYAVSVLPVLAGLISVLFAPSIVDTSGNSTIQAIQTTQLSTINSFLFYSKIALAILFSFFISYKWSLMEIDGSYGFWLTQLVRRSVYFLRANAEFIIVSALGILLGIGMLMYPIGITLTNNQLIFLLLLTLVSIVQLVAFATLFGELIKDPELAMIGYITFVGTILFGFSDKESIINQILSPEQHFYTDFTILSLLLSSITILLVYTVAFLIHVRRSIEL